MLAAMIMLDVSKLRMNESAASRPQRCANARTWSSRATIRSISGVAPFCQQHLPGQHRLSANICQ
jgi:hypothetical protein